ncbi:hypothetical protein HDU76_004159 [Blyttiomyces sp. JEL0837]|nr:hypothetical protein HDU76_004159 [Blyttiomyces sp. JEL0837]
MGTGRDLRGRGSAAQPKLDQHLETKPLSKQERSAATSVSSSSQIPKPADARMRRSKEQAPSQQPPPKADEQ